MATSKKCGRCKEEKDFNDFSKNRAKSDGMNIYCKNCCNYATKSWRNVNTKKMAEYKKTYRDLNKSEIKDYMLRLRYNISLEDFQNMTAKQNGKCAICTKTEKLVVDHCHKTGKVRGLLCTRCNKALGVFKDNTDILNKAIVYLKGEF